jgi:hypothetical protein
MTEPTPFGPRRLKLWLAPDVTHGNVYALLFGSFFGIVMMSFVNASQPFLFSEVQKIPAAEQGPLAPFGLVASANLVVLALALALLASGKAPAAAPRPAEQREAV